MSPQDEEVTREELVHAIARAMERTDRCMEIILQRQRHCALICSGLAGVGVVVLTCLGQSVLSAVIGVAGLAVQVTVETIRHL